VQLSDKSSNEKVTAVLSDTFAGGGDPRGNSYSVSFDQPFELISGHTYQLEYSVQETGESLYIIGPQDLAVDDNGETSKLVLAEPENLIHVGESYDTTFTPLKTGNLTKLFLNRVVDWEQNTNKKHIEIIITRMTTNGIEELGKATLDAAFPVKNDPRGEGYWVVFEKPIPMDESQIYSISIKFIEGAGAIAIYGNRQANESTWDDVLPYDVYGSNPFDYYNGVYRTDLNFEMYWDDNAAKLQRFETTLNQADYIFISSNRQWGSITRLPEHYPLTTKYYRELIGCPDDKEITWCYSVAKPGMFQGKLGFELVQIFQSDPNIGSIKFNTQFAEEAFTVYDHPKVLIFKKTDTFDSASVYQILGSVDLSNVPSISNYKNDSNVNQNTSALLLPSDRLKTQQSGGTWSNLFDINSIINKYPFVGLIVWYLAISLLGWVVFPTVRVVFHGLKDRGYPFGRLFGMILLAFIVWILGSYQVPFINTTILISLLAIVLINAILALVYRKDLLSDLTALKKSLWQTELVSLAFFTFFALIRLGNPDLWHPYKGGEKPMDFSYFNAVLKSTSFPPYDPWYAGGYINYYYYGYVIVGVPVKLLGIVPSIAYNFILPTLFSLVGLGAYSIGWNLTDALNNSQPAAENPNQDAIKEPEAKRYFPLWLGGVIAAVVLLIIGNLGTVRMIWNGLQKLASNGVAVEQGSFFQRWIWTFQGIGKFLTGKSFTYAPGDWYWVPSRAIPGDAITEFPFFTFLYADLHAHMIALPITICAIGWSLAMVLRKWKWTNSDKNLGWLSFFITFVSGGLIIGALKPTNTWDIYTFLPFALIAVAYTAIKYLDTNKLRLIQLKPILQKIFIAILCCGLLIGIALLAYKPFSVWYRQGYNSVEIWKGDRTPFWSYITHWGLFLFIIISWLFVEIRDWMKTTPASELKKLRPFRELIWAGGLIAVIGIIVLLVLKVQIAWLVIPLILISLVLLFRKTQLDLKRFILFMIATGLTLTIVVELVVLKGDIGRMNTVFKIYLQAWSLLALSSAFSLVELAGHVFGFVKSGWKSAWKIGLSLLIFGAALFPITAGFDKIRDRMSSKNTLTLDGSKFMLTSTYGENGTTMNLSEDFYAIQWMQQNVIGSPVIVEGNVPEYQWGSRFTIYTGLPGVVGWNWHQRQQRGVVSAEAVQNRVDEVGLFYQTDDRTVVEKFLNKYSVRYIIVGQLERAIYSSSGISKFEQLNGILWHEVYHQGDTVIYQVGGSS
jgi:YYY domain-containing protein